MLKKITFEERKHLEKLVQMGISLKECARRMNRPPTTITQEIKRTGGRENYNATEAQKQSEERIIKRNLVVSKHNKEAKENHPIARMKTKIDNIEMQLEIVIDQLKELLNDRQNH